MKKLFVLMALMAGLSCLQAQTIPGFMNYETVGRDLLNNNEIVAFKTSFEIPIHSASFDTVTNTALVTLWKDPGESQIVTHGDYTCTVVYFDLENNQSKWQRQINLQDGKYWKKGPFVFREFGKDISLIDEETGKEKYKIGVSVHPLAYDTEEGWMIYATERSLTRGTDLLKRVDLKTNKVDWKSKFVSEQDLDIRWNLNDSVVLIVGDGLHAVNVKDGSGWFVKLVTEVGAYYPVKIYSQPLIDSTFVYMAGSKEIVKVDHSGKEIWRTELPSKKMSYSSLGVYKDLLVLATQGIARVCPYPYQTFLMPWGRPFFAAFDLNTGKMLYTHERSKNADYVLDAIHHEDSLYMVVADQEDHQSIEKYLISTGELLEKKDFPPMMVHSSGGITGFVGPQVYVKADSSFVRVIDKDTLGVCVFCEKGIIQLDSKLRNMEYYSYDELYVYQGKHDDYRFYSHEGKTVVADADGKEVAILDFPQVYCTASEIYSIKDKSIYVIKKESVLK